MKKGIDIERRKKNKIVMVALCLFVKVGEGEGVVEGGLEDPSSVEGREWLDGGGAWLTSF